MKYITTLIVVISLQGCVSVSSNSLNINQGDSKQNVIAIMGSPGDRQFKKDKEAWQYCSTGFASDDYMIIWFEGDAVTGLNSYKNHAPGACSSFFKPIKWENAPDKTIELRNR